MPHCARNTFLAPIPTQELVNKLRTQRHITTEHKTRPGGNHLFGNEMDQRMRRSTNISTFGWIRSVRCGKPVVPFGNGSTSCLEPDDVNGEMPGFGSELIIE